MHTIRVCGVFDGFIYAQHLLLYQRRCGHCLRLWIIASEQQLLCFLVSHLAIHFQTAVCYCSNKRKEILFFSFPFGTTIRPKASSIYEAPTSCKKRNWKLYLLLFCPFSIQPAHFSLTKKKSNIETSQYDFDSFIHKVTNKKDRIS